MPIVLDLTSKISDLADTLTMIGRPLAVIAIIAFIVFTFWKPTKKNDTNQQS